MQASENGEAEMETESSGGIFHRLFSPPPLTSVLSLPPCSSAPIAFTATLENSLVFLSHSICLVSFLCMFNVFQLPCNEHPSAEDRRLNWSTVFEHLKPLHAFVALSTSLCPDHTVLHKVFGHSVVIILLLLIYFRYN